MAQAAPRNPASMDQFSALGGAPQAAAARQDSGEHMSLRLSKLAPHEEEVQTSPGLSLSPPDTPRTHARRHTHPPDTFNPTPPSRQEKKRAHEEARMKGRTASKRAAEERGVSVPVEEELPAGQAEAPKAAAEKVQGWELPTAPALVQTFSRKDGARGRGTPRGRGRKAFAGGGPVRSRRRSVTPGRSGSPAAEHGAEPQPDQAPAESEGTYSAVHASQEEAGGQAAEAAPKVLSASAKKRASAVAAAARAAKKPRRDAAADTSAGTSNDRGATTGPGSSNGQTAGIDPGVPSHCYPVK